MPLSLRWVGESEYDTLAEVRARSYAPVAKDVAVYKERLLADRRARPGDHLLAERDGRIVGTTTSLSMTMWARGGSVTCQGVAFVGTIKTARRGGSKSSGERGIASQLMFEALRKARERQQVVSALMPFRASFYEHFGYGLAEQRAEWTVPLSILPSGDFEGIRFREPNDNAEIERCRQRACEAGQCDIETSHEAWLNRWRQGENGMEVVDRPGDTGPVHGWMYLSEEKRDNKTFMRVVDHGYDSHAALMRQLQFLGSLKDQYSAAIIVLPGDLALNRILKESQLPHRAVEHSVAQVKPFTRMQLRVLDHKRWIEAMHLPPQITGRVNVAVRETEGSVSKFRIELADGHASVTPSEASADVECPDVQWASVSSGDLPASTAARLGLIQANNPAALRVLDAFSLGQVPFCREYF